MDAEHVTLELRQSHRAKLPAPQISRGMQEIEVRFRSGNFDFARHAEARVEQWPIERFAVESDEHAPLGHALGESVELRMFFAVLAHEELLHLEAAGVPPGDANEKSVGARAAGEAGGFRVEEKPLLGIGGAFRRIR